MLGKSDSLSAKTRCVPLTLVLVAMPASEAGGSTAGSSTVRRGKSSGNFAKDSTSEATRGLKLIILKELEEDDSHVLPVYDLVMKRKRASHVVEDDLLSSVEQHGSASIARMVDDSKLGWLEQHCDLTSDDLLLAMKALFARHQQQRVLGFCKHWLL